MSLLAIGDFYTRVNIWTLSQEMVTAKKKKTKSHGNLLSCYCYPQLNN